MIRTFHENWRIERVQDQLAFGVLSKLSFITGLNYVVVQAESYWLRNNVRRLTNLQAGQENPHGQARVILPRSIFK